MRARSGSGIKMCTHYKSPRERPKPGFLTESVTCSYGVTQSQPFTAVLLAAVLEIVRTEPTSELSATYRRWVRTAMFPSIFQVAEILRSHACTVEVSDGRRAVRAASYPCWTLRAAVAVDCMAEGKVPR